MPSKLAALSTERMSLSGASALCERHVPVHSVRKGRHPCGMLCDQFDVGQAFYFRQDDGLCQSVQRASYLEMLTL